MFARNIIIRRSASFQTLHGKMKERKDIMKKIESKGMKYQRKCRLTVSNGSHED